MKKSLLIILLVTASAFAQTDYTRYVNPFIGTGGHGHTFPGATMPFGMVQLSPDTRVDNWDGSSGYHYSDSIIYGFSHTHLSGTGIPDYCDILVAPYVSKQDFFTASPEDTLKGFASKFSHVNERAEPGYYSVTLDDENIFAEMTATPRVGFHRYTFPEKTSDAKIAIDLKWRDYVIDSELKIVAPNRVEGFRRSRSWAKDQVVYFAAEFSKPFAENKIGGSDPRKDIRAMFRFDVAAGEKLLVKVAISAVSVDGARKNLAAELPGWNFDATRARAKAEWNKELSQIAISGASDAEMTNFYTALYHTKVQPNLFSDVDGSYRGLDKKTHNLNDQSAVANRKSNYTVFSLWDTFRAAHPLYTITDRRRTADFINTFIHQYQQGGRLPVWELAANETDTMIGYHAVSVIADAMVKGIEGFDYKLAYEASKHSAELDHFGLAAYKKRGYISSEDENEAVSKTLEYAYNDFCIAQMANVLYERERQAWIKGGSLIPRSAAPKPGQKKRQWIPPFDRYKWERENYLERARSYRNLFDPKTGFMRARQNGNWTSPFVPGEVNFSFTEGNSWVYTFFVPQDVNGLIDLFGSPARFATRLDELFTTSEKLSGRVQPDITGLIGQYAHGNEPSHHIAYLFNYAGEPWKTQDLARRIMDEFYKPEPDGLIGNEDCGQMSAWYILSSLGIYPVTPGIANYDLGAPLFREARVRLENGRFITVRARGEKNGRLSRFVKSVLLNGKPLRRTFVTHEELNNGATIEFEMTDAPVRDWFTEFSSSRIDKSGPAVPVIEASRTFRDTATVTIKPLGASEKIFYTTDGSEPTADSKGYDAPFEISATTTIRAIAIDANGRRSRSVDANSTKIPHDWSVKLLSKYNRQYTGGGDHGLIDGVRGTVNFASGEWQGYQSQDFVAIIDLKRQTEIKRVGGGFLQIAGSWIWMPTRVIFEVSDDGETFRRVTEIKTDVAPEDMTQTVRDYVADIAPVKARYVRVTAINLGKIPAWHPGAGFDAFIFVDEIVIE